MGNIVPRDEPNTRVRTFLTLNEDGSILHHFPPAAELEERYATHGLMLQNGENCFAVFVMGMQSGVISWGIMYSAVDSFVLIDYGIGSDLKTVQDNMNKALTKMLDRWLEMYLPEN